MIMCGVDYDDVIDGFSEPAFSNNKNSNKLFCTLDSNLRVQAIHNNHGVSLDRWPLKKVLNVTKVQQI